MRFSRTKSDCANCPLRDRKRVPSIGPEDVGKIVLIGESPGAIEEINGEPFVGPAGKYLTWGLSSAGILRHRCYILNLINCRPPGDNLSSPEGQEALRRCAPGFEQELSFILSHAPAVLVPLGAEPASALSGGRLAITRVRGSVSTFRGIPVLPTFHPSYLNRMTRDQGEKGKPFFKWVWIADLKKAKRIAASGWAGPAERFNLSPTLEELEEYVAARTSNHDLVGVDIETSGRGAQTQIVVVGLAHTGKDAISVPFLTKGGHPYWERNGDFFHVENLLRKLFSECPLVFQNALFDVRILRALGYPIPAENVKHDILLLHHAQNPELPHDLAFITSCYGETPYWKNVMKESDVPILEREDEEVRTYNLRDCVVLHQDFPGLWEDLEETGTKKVYLEESMPLIEPYLTMMNNGILLDEGRLEACAKKLKKEKGTLEKDLKSLAALPAAFNLSSDDDLRYFLYGIVPKKIQGVEEKLASKKRKDTKVYRELEGLLEIKEKTKPIAPIPTSFRGRTTATGKKSVKEQVLLSLQRAYQNRLESISRQKMPKEEEAAQIRKFLEWLAVYYKWAEVDKLISTYTHFPIAEDGRVHTQLLIHGTATGRPASRKPNLLNIPKENLDIRRCFVAPEGSTMLACDYSQFEVRITAYETGDESLIRMLEEGRSVHDENTKLMFGFEKKDPLWKAGRNAVKVGVFGGFTYGGGDQEIYERMIQKSPQLALTFARYKEAKDRYMREHPELVRYHREIEAAVKDPPRKLTNFMGRVRFFLGEQKDIIKEAYNFKIQSGAASILNRALVRIDKIMKERKMKSKLLLYIYDELLFEVPEEELEEMKKLVTEEMQRPVKFYGREVYFPIEIKTGPSWGELTA